LDSAEAITVPWSCLSLYNTKIIIEYNGTRFFGWGIQPDRVTIQGEIEKALEKITGDKITLIGAGRTDAGVHATGQVANFATQSKMNAGIIAKALNANLPCDIRIVDAQDVDYDFHSRFSAKSKLYVYNVLFGRYVPAFLKDFVYGVFQAINVDDMNRAAEELIGEHDFSSFCIVDGMTGKNFTRKIISLKIEERDVSIYPLQYDQRFCKVVSFSIRANGFLYKMVRGIAGTLLDVGRGRITHEDVKNILDAKDRRLAGPNVPGRGLCLVNVEY